MISPTHAHHQQLIDVLKLPVEIGAPEHLVEHINVRTRCMGTRDRFSCRDQVRGLWRLKLSRLLLLSCIIISSRQELSQSPNFNSGDYTNTTGSDSVPVWACHQLKWLMVQLPKYLPYPRHIVDAVRIKFEQHHSTSCSPPVVSPSSSLMFQHNSLHYNDAVFCIVLVPDVVGTGSNTVVAKQRQILHVPFLRIIHHHYVTYCWPYVVNVILQRARRATQRSSSL